MGIRRAPGGHREREQGPDDPHRHVPAGRPDRQRNATADDHRERPQADGQEREAVVRGQDRALAMLVTPDSCSETGGKDLFVPIPDPRKRYRVVLELYREQHLRDRLVRVLHERSFVDDPTRIFRAARYESRLDFRMDPKTETLALMASHRDVRHLLRSRQGRSIASSGETFMSLMRLGRYADL